MSQDGVNLFAQGEETRVVLADRAGRTARRNQPRYLLVAAGGLVAIALVWLVLAWWRGESAAGVLFRERALSFEVNRLVEEYKAEQDAQGEALGEESRKANPNLQYVIERLGKECGLTNMVISVADDTTRTTRNLKRKKFSYTNFPPQETEAILCWINKVKKEVAGAELSNVEIEPALGTVDGKARWKGTIAFTRWEVKAN